MHTDFKEAAKGRIFRRVRFSGPVIPLLAISIVSMAACTSFAQDDWTLTTADFRTQRVTLAGMNDSGVQVIAAGQAAAKTVPLDQFLDVSRTIPSPAANANALAPLELYLMGGDHLTGAPVGIREENLGWKNPVLGEVNVPLRQIVAIEKSTQPPPREDQPRTEDVAQLSNGDSVHGIVSTITADTVTISSNGQDVPVPLATISSLTLAATPGATQQTSHARAFRVTLADGSTFTGSSIALTKDLLAITPASGDGRNVPINTVARIEQINGPVSWLASRTPVENVQIPYFSSQTQPAKMGISLDGQPVRIGENTYPHAIAVHSYSRLVYALDPQYKTFRTQFAIDGNLPYANVTIRIKLDDKPVYEQKDVTAGKISDPVTVDLNGTKHLTLEVDYGKTYDVQDRVDWLEPALLKTAISSQPSK